MPKRKVGRPKGRRYVPVTLTLTPEDAEFLASKPNASALIREFLESLRKAKNVSSEYTRLVGLKKSLDELNERTEELKHERDEAMKIALDSKHFAGHYVGSFDRTYWEVNNPENPEPIDDEGRIACKFRDATNAEIKRLEQKAAKVRAELLA